MRSMGRARFPQRIARTVKNALFFRDIYGGGPSLAEAGVSGVNFF
jgi:hypothetical protein